MNREQQTRKPGPRVWLSGLLVLGCFGLAASATAESVVPGGTVPYAWYRADTGVILNDDDEVVGWADQSGNARDVDVVSGSPLQTNNAPNGGPTLTFDGNDIFVGQPLLDPLGTPDPTKWGYAAAGTVLAVWSPTDYDPAHREDITYVYDGRQPASGKAYMYRQFLSYSRTHEGDTGEVLGQYIEVGARDVTLVAYNVGGIPTADIPGMEGDILGKWLATTTTHTTGTNDVFRINGWQAFSGNLYGEGINGLTIGADRRINAYEFRGHMAELIVFEGALSPTEMASVEAAVMDRWAVTAIPEPGSCAMVLGLALAAALLRRRLR